MDILNKSTLTIVVVTAIASGMMLLTGNIVADNEANNANNETATKIEKVTIRKQSEKSGNKTLSVAKSLVISIAPPPGPFINIQQAVSAPLAPKMPTNNSVQPAQPAQSGSLTNVPQSPVRGNVAEAKLKKPSPAVEPLKPQNMNQNLPKFNKEVGSAPKAAQAPTFNSTPDSKGVSMPIAPKNTMKIPSMNPANQPIWMQKGNIVQKGINPSSMNMNQKYGNIVNGQQQNTMGMPNIGWNNNYPPQQYMYIPVPMMPMNGMPPQIPMFNKSITPPQNSWMPNTLNNMPTTQEKIAPMQKETK